MSTTLRFKAPPRYDVSHNCDGQTIEVHIYGRFVDWDELCAALEPFGFAHWNGHGWHLKGDAFETLHMINQLRECECAAVTIVCDNPEGSGADNCAIRVSDDWTNYIEREFAAVSVADALRQALAARAEIFAREGVKTEAKQVPAEWREFVRECIASDGNLINGTELAKRARGLLGIPSSPASAPEWKRDNDVIFTLLCLVSEGEGISEEMVVAWPDAQARAVEEYCRAAHYQASDNDVDVPPKPGVLSEQARAEYGTDPDAYMLGHGV